MKLLIVTQKIDNSDDVLGFFIGWIVKFTRRFESVTIICLFAGQYQLPSNVRVFSLGKETGYSRIKHLYRFYKLVWRLRGDYDSVFVHMNPVYVVLGGVLWRLWNKRVSLWYAHGYVPYMLRVAAILTDVIFTSTREGCRIKSDKIKVVGQGIDVERFQPVITGQEPRVARLRVVSVGRISPSKDYATLILAIAQLPRGAIDWVKIYGQPATLSDNEYLHEMKALIQDRSLFESIRFMGPVANKDLAPVLQSADVFVNMSHTGSLDKAILEAMACGCLVLTCNEALTGVLDKYAGKLMYSKRDFTGLADKIKTISAMPESERSEIRNGLRSIVTSHHALVGLIDKISGILSNYSKSPQ